MFYVYGCSAFHPLALCHGAQRAARQADGRLVWTCRGRPIPGFDGESSPSGHVQKVVVSHMGDDRKPSVRSLI